jgi:hypothetical protein
VGLRRQTARDIRVRNDPFFDQEIDGIAANLSARLCVLNLRTGDRAASSRSLRT